MNNYLNLTIMFDLDEKIFDCMIKKYKIYKCLKLINSQKYLNSNLIFIK